MLGLFGLLSVGAGAAPFLSGLIGLLFIIWLICFFIIHPKIFWSIVIAGIGWGVYEIVSSIKESNFKEKYSSEKLVTNSSFKISDFGSEFISHNIKNISLYDWDHQEVINNDTIYSMYTSSYILHKYLDGNDLNSFVYGIRSIKALNSKPYLIEYHLNKCINIEEISNSLLKKGYVVAEPNIESDFFDKTYKECQYCFKKGQCYIEIDTLNIEKYVNNIYVYDINVYQYVEKDLRKYEEDEKMRREMIKQRNISNYIASN